MGNAGSIIEYDHGSAALASLGSGTQRLMQATADAPDLTVDGPVIAVVVTYQPDENLCENLRALVREVTQVVVVDNGSANFDAVDRAAQATGCTLISNRTNAGVAHALNQGVDEARRRGCAWVATFDQDSLAPAGMVSGLLALRQCHPMRDRIGVLVASHRDRATGTDYLASQDVLEVGDGWRLVRTTITSGAMISAEVLDNVGPFDEQLFIDFVDHDFYMRCRKHGYLLLEGTRQVLVHSLGRTTQHRLLGRRVTCTNHSARRRYYMTRNQLEVYTRYLIEEPPWAVRGLYYLAVGSVIALIFEDNRAAKARAMLRGCFDFALRRFGPLAD